MNNSLLFKRFLNTIIVPKLRITCHNGLVFGIRQLSSRKLPTLTMFTKEECSLCDDARLILEEYKHRSITYGTDGKSKSTLLALPYNKHLIKLVCWGHTYHFEEVYITDKGNEKWYMKYKYDIPVFHLNGTFLMQHRVDRKLLEDKLTEWESE